MRRKSLLVYVLVMAILVAGVFGAPAPVRASVLAQGSGITLIAPSACPPGGCAAGQRLTYQLDFELGVYNAALAVPNVKVCVYIPTSWYDSTSVNLDPSGAITGNPYNNVAGTTNCPEDDVPPTNYTLAAAGESLFQGVFVFHDSLDFSFRILGTANSSGSVLMRVFERTTDTSSPTDWTRTAQVFTPQLTPILPGTNLFVADTPSACTSNPCYLNSGGDFPGGVGTGLKDAVDVAPDGAQITILGSVALKGSTVQVNRALTLQGSGDATLTSSGSVCTSPMLEITAGGVLRNLNIKDGSCASPDRTLLVVNTTADYLIESNDLTGGADAINVAGANGNLVVRYNHISGNSGYALYWDTGDGAGSLNMVANNLGSNRAGGPVECSAGATAPLANRRIEHNYWGGQTAPSAASTHCTITPGKQLGAPVLANAASPGVSAQRVTVTTNKTYGFDNQIAFQRSADGNDYDLYLVNHGTDSPNAIPFTASTTGSPNPCSNYWDVFLADGAAPAGSLDISLKYNRSTACIAVIESSQFCEQTSNTSKFPLWWYDPISQVTSGWDTTGQNPAGSGANGVSGQTTTCDMANDEIRVTIDNSGRPNLTNDFNYTPLMIGLPVPSTFKTLASDKTVTVVWTTLTEADLKGYYVLRANAAAGPFDPISDLIQRKGSAIAGSDYSFVDGGRTNGVANYYRLKIVKDDDTFFYSEILSIIPNVATATPTPTKTPTRTPTITRTPTVRIPTATRFPTSTRFATSTRLPTATLLRTPTRQGGATSIFSSGSSTPTPFTIYLGTETPFPGTGYPGPQGTEGYPGPEQTFGPGTPSPQPTLLPGQATLTPTPVGGAVSGENPRNASDWISLVLGLLMSAIVVFGLAWFFFIRPKTPAA